MALTVSQRHPPDVRGTQEQVVDRNEMGQCAKLNDTGWRSSLVHHHECSDKIWQSTADDGTRDIGDEGIKSHDRQDHDLPRV